MPALLNADCGINLSQGNRAVTPKCDGPDDSICLFARFLTTALACECFLHAFLLAGLKVKRVTFHFLDNVLLLYLSLKAAKCILEGLALLQSDFSQTDYTPLLVLSGPFCYGKPSVPKSSGMCKNIEPHFKTGISTPVAPTVAHTR